MAMTRTPLARFALAALLGAVLAGIYGLALGCLRVFTCGLGLPVIAHIVADATIFILVVNSRLL